MGNNALLGILIYRIYYPNVDTLYISENSKSFSKFTSNHNRWIYHFDTRYLSYFIYPIKSKNHSFPCKLNKTEFEILKQKAIYVEKAFNIDYYFIKSQKHNKSLGLFFYKDNFIIAPMVLENTMIEQITYNAFLYIIGYLFLFLCYSKI